MSAVAFTVVVAALVSTSGAVLPQFSWDTLPVFFHSANLSGPYSADAIRVLAKYAMVTIDQAQGFHIPNVDDEDEMVLAMKAVKLANPKVATIFYMNSLKDCFPMERMHRQVQEHPDWILHDRDGQPVKGHQGLAVFDLSNPDVRQWWMKTCLDAVSAANGDGCFADGSHYSNASFPNVSPLKLQEWDKGMLQMTRDVQQQLGDDKLLIGKAPDQPYVKAAMIEYFKPDNDSINGLMLGVVNGKVMQAHVPIYANCKEDVTDYMAAFLIGAGKYSYFGCGNWTLTGDDNEPWYWRPEYDYPLGDPVGPPSYVSGVWKCSFASGTEVMFDTSNNKGTIHWSKPF